MISEKYNPLPNANCPFWLERDIDAYLSESRIIIYRDASDAENVRVWWSWFDDEARTTGLFIED